MTDPTGMFGNFPDLTSNLASINALIKRVAAVTPHGGGTPNPRAVRAWDRGVVKSAAWQVPGVEHGKAAKGGFVIKVEKLYGQGTFGFAHADPTSAPPVGTYVNPGDFIGTYASPTNGSSTGDHAHLFDKDKDGNFQAPPIDGVPVVENQVITTQFGAVDASHDKPHTGTDVVNSKANAEAKAAAAAAKAAADAAQKEKSKAKTPEG